MDDFRMAKLVVVGGEFKPVTTCQPMGSKFLLMD